MFPEGLLLDFAKAFPSMSHRGMCRILRRCKGQRHLEHHVFLFTNMSTTMLYEGHAPSTFSTTRGIKQDRPLSGTLFVLGLDPLVRRYMHDMVLSTTALALLCTRRQLVVVSPPHEKWGGGLWANT